MTRSYKKNPFTKGRHSSWKWDRTRSARDYRRFYRQKISSEKFDEIHNKYKTFHDNWDWSPDYMLYYGDYRRPAIGFSQWRVYRDMREGMKYEDAVEHVLEEKRQEYKKIIRK